MTDNAELGEVNVNLGQYKDEKDKRLAAQEEYKKQCERLFTEVEAANKETGGKMAVETEYRGNRALILRETIKKRQAAETFGPGQSQERETAVMFTLSDILQVDCTQKNIIYLGQTPVGERSKSPLMQLGICPFAGSVHDLQSVLRTALNNTLPKELPPFARGLNQVTVKT